MLLQLDLDVDVHNDKASDGLEVQFILLYNNRNSQRFSITVIHSSMALAGAPGWSESHESEYCYGPPLDQPAFV
jgi:hypothetical protein